MKTAFDKLGREIRVGDFIAYGHALGRCAGLRVGKVLRIKHSIESSWGRNEDAWSITVWGIDDDWRSTRLCNRAGTLLYPNRIIVLDPEKVPSDYRELLATKNG